MTVIGLMKGLLLSCSKQHSATTYFILSLYRSCSFHMFSNIRVVHTEMSGILFCSIEISSICLFKSGKNQWQSYLSFSLKKYSLLFPQEYFTGEFQSGQLCP